jgi:DNA polymerase-1
MSDDKLLLIDAHALIHRAYHAIPTDLLSPQGEPTKAVFGFTSTLLKVLKDVQPRFVAAAFDVGKSFRSDRYAEYKATRPRMADDLRSQIERCRQICETFGIPIFAVPGFEADDLIGALAQQASAREIETIILTGDTDTFQLIDAHTNVLTFSRQFGDTVLYDAAKVEERYALKPRQLIDLKALRGDPSDNIPGVSGVGDKTATKLLQTYGSIEGIFERIDEIDAKTGEKLVPREAQVRLSKQLVTIDCNAPAKLDLDAARLDGYDRERVIQLFRELGFQSLVSRLPESTHEVYEPTPDSLPEYAATLYHSVTTEAELNTLVKKLKASKGFVVDVETTSLDSMAADLVGLAIGVGGGEAYYIPLGHQNAARKDVPTATSASTASKSKQKSQPSLFEQGTETITVNKGEEQTPIPQLPRELVVKKLAPIFADAKIPKYAHNSKYDLVVLAQAGIETKGLAFDSLLAAHLLEPTGQKLGLKELVFAKLGFEMTEIEALIGKGKGQLAMSDVSVEAATRYAASDADYTFRLVELYKPQLKTQGLDKLFYELEIPLVPVIVQLERAGVMLDVAALASLSEKINARMKELETQVYEMCGGEFNLSSPQQLSDALFVKLGLPTARLERTRTGQISTAAGVLEGLKDEHPVIPLILEHRELSKLKGTYVDALPQLVNPRDGRLHTSFNQAGSVTGRISSSNPNLQNIPVKSELGRLVRRAFIAPPGKVLLSADYSQVELRILAHITQDPNLLQAFAEDEDIHTGTAALLFNVPIDQVTPRMRRLGKTINYGVAYGISDWGIAGRTELNLEESRQLIHNYYEKYPRIKAYIERTKQQAHAQGYVESLMGRRRYFPELGAGRRVPVGVRNQAEREAINMPIQATAADIIKLAMIQLHRELEARGLQSKVILQVHDELVLESPRDEVDTVAPLVCEIMEHAYELAAPLEADVKVGQNWDEMEPVAVRKTNKRKKKTK